jgi:small subunit ribosomal protein S17
MSETVTDSSTPPAPEAPDSAPAAPQTRRNLRKTRVGEVVSHAMNKTIVVRTVTRVPHQKFRKIVKHVKKFYVHDENNEAKVGDRVSIMESRPLSRLKRWRLVEVLRH